MVAPPFKRLPVLLATALILSFPAIVAASPESRELIRQGAGDLKEQKYDEALKKFEAASKTDPKDAEAFFFQGAALNQLGRPKEALVQIEKATTMGFKGPGLAFDTGWALLGLGRWKEAIAQLEQFEKAVPGRGKTSEFMGRAYFGLRDYDKASANLREALRRDRALKSTALLYLAVLEQERKNPASARQYLETLLRESPHSPIAQVLKERLEQLRRQEKKG